MPYAFVAQVEFSDDDVDTSRRALTEGLIPVAKGLPGFQSGVWARSGRKGMGMIVFDTEENATSGQEAIRASRPADAPPITDAGIYEVMGQA
ncbi:MAG TPA: hypothetical protein VJ804_06825 [Acidimicrobiales bacterium]|nr:hypothetical protein [Acidimicrobiales bacterium]